MVVFCERNLHNLLTWTMWQKQPPSNSNASRNVWTLGLQRCVPTSNKTEHTYEQSITVLYAYHLQFVYRRKWHTVIHCHVKKLLQLEKCFGLKKQNKQKKHYFDRRTSFANVAISKRPIFRGAIMRLWKNCFYSDLQKYLCSWPSE